MNNRNISYNNSYKIIDNVTLYCNDSIDESIIKQLRDEMLKVMEFFKLKELNKKVNIRIWDNGDEFRKECSKLNGVELPFWAVGIARNEKDEEYSYIDKLSLEEQKKIDYHKDATLDDFIKSIVHEFVHVCHTQFCNYNYPEEPWVSEGIATYLANQYPNSEYTVSIKEVFGYDEVPYQNYRCLYNYIFDNYSYDDIMKLLNSDLSLIDNIANFHINFEHIHPFEDGNGRTGRVLINHELISSGEIPIVIPEERRIEYFEYLSNYDRDGLAHMIRELQQVELNKMKDYGVEY